jgi:hypothetical protein
MVCCCYFKSLYVLHVFVLGPFELPAGCRYAKIDFKRDYGSKDNKFVEEDLNCISVVLKRYDVGIGTREVKLATSCCRGWLGRVLTKVSTWDSCVARMADPAWPIGTQTNDASPHYMHSACR